MLGSTEDAAAEAARRLGARRPAEGVDPRVEAESDALALAGGLALSVWCAGAGVVPGDPDVRDPEDVLLAWCLATGSDDAGVSAADLSARVRDGLVLLAELGDLSRQSEALKIEARAALAAWRRSPVYDGDRDVYDALVLRVSRLRARMVELVEALAGAGPPDAPGGTVGPAPSDDGETGCAP